MLPAVDNTTAAPLILFVPRLILPAVHVIKALPIATRLLLRSILPVFVTDKLLKVGLEVDKDRLELVLFKVTAPVVLTTIDGVVLTVLITPDPEVRSNAVLARYVPVIVPEPLAEAVTVVPLTWTPGVVIAPLLAVVARDTIPPLLILLSTVIELFAEREKLVNDVEEVVKFTAPTFVSETAPVVLMVKLDVVVLRF